MAKKNTGSKAAAKAAKKAKIDKKIERKEKKKQQKSGAASDDEDLEAILEKVSTLDVHHGVSRCNVAVVDAKRLGRQAQSYRGAGGRSSKPPSQRDVNSLPSQ